MGSEGRRPDTQAELANERTYLAWLRTGLALVASGVAVYAVACFLTGAFVLNDVKLLLRRSREA